MAVGINTHAVMAVITRTITELNSIILLKCCTLGGMLMLHTKVKFALTLRKEPQEELFGDADKPTARDSEYSA